LAIFFSISDYMNIDGIIIVSSIIYNKNTFQHINVKY